MLTLRSLIRIASPQNVVTRMYHGKHNKKYLYRDGKLVNNTIYYYPRKPNEVEPEVIPTKLFRVERVKAIKGNPYWERQLLREFGLFGSPNVCVVKNIPENNARLWNIKHLVKITPINFPHGEPTAADLNHTYLKENGDCVVIKSIDNLNTRLEAAEKFKKNEKELDGDTLRKDTREKWNNAW